MILAPIGRDGTASADLLRRVGLEADGMFSLDQVMDRLQARGGGAHRRGGSVWQGSVEPYDWVEHQPAWSDLPFIVLTGRQEQPRRRLAPATGFVAAQCDAA